MGKKKKKKSNENYIPYLKDLDKDMDKKHKEIIREIQDMQDRINLADVKATKKIKKKLRKDMGVVPYYMCPERVTARESVLKDMERTQFLDRIEAVLIGLVPIIVLIARLVANLILSIFAFDPIRNILKPDTIKRLDHIYDIAMAIK